MAGGDDADHIFNKTTNRWVIIKGVKGKEIIKKHKDPNDTFQLRPENVQKLKNIGIIQNATPNNVPADITDNQKISKKNNTNDSGYACEVLQTKSDGNCFYRAIFKSITGNNMYYILSHLELPSLISEDEFVDNLRAFLAKFCKSSTSFRKMFHSWIDWKRGDPQNSAALQAAFDGKNWPTWYKKAFIQSYDDDKSIDVMFPKFVKQASKYIGTNMKWAGPLEIDMMNEVLSQVGSALVILSEKLNSLSPVPKTVYIHRGIANTHFEGIVCTTKPTQAKQSDRNTKMKVNHNSMDLAQTIQTQMNSPTFKTMFPKYQPNENIEIRPKDGWILPNRVKFARWVEETFRYNNANKHFTKTPIAKSTKELFPSQRFVKDFMQYDSPYRGLLLYHDVGTGKTKASIVAAENLIGQMKVIILLPAFLHANYNNEIKTATNSFFKLDQKWTWHAYDSFKHIAHAVCETLSLTHAFVKKQGGVWVPDKGVPIASSSWFEDNKSKIDFQLTAMINNKYKFIHYDGLNEKKIADFKNKGVFNNKLIIVDEVHNLISGTVNGAKIKTQLYELLLFAKNTRFILLSGTPLINHPFEISFIINLLKGPQRVYKTEYPKSDSTDIEQALINNPFVDNYKIEHSKNVATFQLLPDGFSFSDKQSLLVHRDPTDTKTIIETIKTESKAPKAPSPASQLKTLVFPFFVDVTKFAQAPKSRLTEIKEAFNERFVDFEHQRIQNPLLLARRLSGCISYFGKNSKDYADIVVSEPITLSMTPRQFLVYRDQRIKEIDKEAKAKQGVKKDDNDLFSNKGQVYRTFTRCICNFAFPDDIERQFGIAGFSKTELDVNDEVDDGDNGDVAIIANHDDKNSKYEKMLKASLSKLNDQRYDLLKLPNLSSLSPKFAKIIKTLNASKGKALVYSQFRRVEGLGVLAIALNANGWSEFKLKKDGNEWVPDIKPEDVHKPHYFKYTKEDQRDALVNIFNNNLSSSVREMFGNKNNLHGDILKLIMITQSGAEGLSLKHVRQVHIMEPYWNEIRIQQVIGRAVRAQSHLELAVDERNVTVFRYLMQLPVDKQKQDITLSTKDKGLSTDEYIYGIAQRKDTIISQLLELMKSASVDCLVHSHLHNKDAKPGKEVRCLQFPNNENPNALAYELDMAYEEDDAEYKQKIVKSTKKQALNMFKKCKIDGVVYAYHVDTQKVYDIEKYKQGSLVQVGYLNKREGNTAHYQLVLF